MVCNDLLVVFKLKPLVISCHLQVIELMKSGELGQSVIQMLWERFTMKIPGTTADESRAAVQLISMAAG